MYNILCIDIYILGLCGCFLHSQNRGRCKHVYIHMYLHVLYNVRMYFVFVCAYTVDMCETNVYIICVNTCLYVCIYIYVCVCRRIHMLVDKCETKVCRRNKHCPIIGCGILAGHLNNNHQSNSESWYCWEISHVGSQNRIDICWYRWEISHVGSQNRIVDTVEKFPM